MSEPTISPRVKGHIENLNQAGFDTQKFFDALVQIRDDTLLPKEHREALYKLIAMECYVWYLEALRNEPIDRRILVEEVQKVIAQNEAAIRKTDTTSTSAPAAAPAPASKKK